MVLSFKLGFYKDGKSTDRGFGFFSSLRLSWKLTDVEMECPLPFQRNTLFLVNIILCELLHASKKSS